MKFFSFHVRKSFIITVGSLIVIFFAIGFFASLLDKPPLTSTEEYEKMFREELPAAFEYRQTYYKFMAAHYALEGNLVAANAAYDLAIHYDPENAELYIGHAILKIERKQYDFAIRDLDKAHGLTFLPNLHAQIEELKGTLTNLRLKHEKVVGKK